MRINSRYQELHAREPSMDWATLQAVERDICLLYHQLADYAYIMGDLYFGDVFRLPYWEYLDVELDHAEEAAFLRDGCLVMILAMAWQQIDGAGVYLQPHLGTCRTAIAHLRPNDDRPRKLVATVQLALETAERSEPASEELIALSTWVHREYVQGYFRDRVREFDTNPCFAGGTPAA